MSDPLFDKVVALLQMDGAYDGTSFIDVKGHTVTRGGNVVTKTNHKKFGTASALFDGSGDYLSINHADLNLSASDGCFEAWIYVETAPAVGHGIFAWGTPASSNANRIQLNITPGLGAAVYFEDGAGNNNYLVGPDGSIPLNAWVHLAVVFLGSACRLYLNGTLATGTVYDNGAEVVGANNVIRRSYAVAAGNVLYLGTHRAANAQQWSRCYLDSVRVTKGHPRYLGNFTPGAFDDYRLFVPSKISEQLAIAAWTLRSSRADTGALLSSVQVAEGVSEAPVGTGTSEYSGPVMVRCQPQIDGIFSYDQAYAEGAIVVPDRPMDNPVAYRRNAAPSGDPYYAETVLLLHFDGADGSMIFTDEKGHSVTAGGNNGSLITTQTAVFGGACLKNGAGDYLSAGASADWDLSWSNFTLEAWVYLTTLPASGSNCAIACVWPNPYKWYWGLYNNAGTYQMVFWYYAGGTGQWSKAANLPLPFHTHRWYHLAATKHMGTLRFYLDGIKFYDSGSSNFGVDAVSGAALSIGGNAGSPGQSLLGLIDDLRITLNVARYVGTTCPVPVRAYPHALPTRNEDYATLYIQGEGAANGTVFPELLVPAVGLARVGDTKTSDLIPFLGRSSCYLDGSGDYFTVPIQAGLDVRQRDFTIEGWFNFDALPISGAVVNLMGSWSVTSTSCTLLWSLGNTSGTYWLRLYWRVTGSSLASVAVNLSAAPVCGRWYHLAICRSGTTLRFFLDGARVGADQTMNVTVPEATLTWQIFAADGSSPVKGFVKEFVFSRGLAKYTANFTPPGSLRAPDPSEWSDEEDDEIDDGPYAWTCLGRLPRPLTQGPIQSAGQWAPGQTVALGAHIVPTDRSSAAWIYRAIGYVDPHAGRDLILIPFDGANDTPDFYDATRQQTVIVRGQPVVKTAIRKYGSGSGYFDGTDDTILIPAGSDWDLGYGDFTLEAWIWIAAGSSGPRQIIDKFTIWSTDVDFAFEVKADGHLGFWAGDNIPCAIAGNDVLNTEQWTHVAVTRAANVFRTFVDGTLQSQTYTGQVNIPNGKTTAAIGSNGFGYNYWNGYLDDFRITKGVARYVANFTPPSALFGRQTGTIEPDWPTGIGETVEDGGIVWECIGRYY